MSEKHCKKRTGEVPVIILLWGIYEVEEVAVILQNKIILFVSCILSLSQENLVIMIQGPAEVDIYQNINSFLIRCVLHRIAITFTVAEIRDLRW